MLVPLLALTLLVPQSDGATPGLTRTVLTTTATMEAARVTYAPGAVEPPGNHGYDVVLVPLGDGMTAQVDGAPATWARGVPILISRGAPHSIANRSNRAVSFIEVRTKDDSPASGNDTAAITQATIVRSTVGKYLRATVWRVSGGGTIEWPAGTDQVLIVNRNPAVEASTGPLDEDVVSVLAARVVRNASPNEEIVVRVSRLQP